MKDLKPVTTFYPQKVVRILDNFAKLDGVSRSTKIRSIVEDYIKDKIEIAKALKGE